MLKFIKLNVQLTFYSRLLVLSFLLLVSVTLINATTYYSTGSYSPKWVSSWNSIINGNGSSPSNFTTNGDIFIIQSGHTMKLTNDQDLTIGGGTTNSVVTFQIEGTLDLGKRSNFIIQSFSILDIRSENAIDAKDIKNEKKESNFILKENTTIKTSNPNGFVGTDCVFEFDFVTFPTNLNVEFVGDGPFGTLGIPPSTIKDFEVKGTNTITLTDNLKVTNLTIYPGAKLTQTSGTITATNFTIQSNASGTGTFISNATVSATNTNVEQYLVKGRNWYISSPVVNAKVSSLSSLSPSSVVSYNEAATDPSKSWITESSTNTLTPGKGYIAVNPTANGVVTFSGKLNTGDVTVDLIRTSYAAKNGFNLVGNPYPSYLDWFSITKTNLINTVWYRTKDKTSTKYVFDTFNDQGQLGTNNNGNGAVTKLIPPMQAFWVRVDPLSNTGKIVFKNAARAHQEISSNKFRARAEETNVQKVLRLQVSNNVNSDETIIYFNSTASDDYDEFDSPKMLNSNLTVPEIYTVAGDELLVINGLSNYESEKEIPLGFSTLESNTFSIKATELLNFTDENKLYLFDKQTGIETEMLKDSSYTFASDVYSSTDRFSLIFKSISLTTSSLTTSNTNVGDNSILVSQNDNTIFVNCTDFQKGNVSVYNSLGLLISSEAIVNKLTKIDMKGYVGVCIVNVDVDGQKKVNKLIFK